MSSVDPKLLPARYQAQIAAQLRKTPNPALADAGRANTRAASVAPRSGNHGASMTANRRVGGKLNKTESRFLQTVLIPKIAAGELLYVVPQAFGMDFGDGTSYRPDFLCITGSGEAVLIEVKGGHVGKAAWSRLGLERFRRAREKWPGLKFEMWQEEKGGFVLAGVNIGAEPRESSSVGSGPSLGATSNDCKNKKEKFQ